MGNGMSNGNGSGSVGRWKADLMVGPGVDFLRIDALMLLEGHFRVQERLEYKLGIQYLTDRSCLRVIRSHGV
jgi:hypothetical protein